jgi:hypothetical protein
MSEAAEAAGGLRQMWHEKATLVAKDIDAFDIGVGAKQESAFAATTNSCGKG